MPDSQARTLVLVRVGDAQPADLAGPALLYPAGLMSDQS